MPQVPFQTFQLKIMVFLLLSFFLEEDIALYPIYITSLKIPVTAAPTAAPIAQDIPRAAPKPI